jgi:hypothetical protein
VPRCRQSKLRRFTCGESKSFEVLRDKAIALGLIAIVKTIGDRLKLFDEIEAEIGTESPDVLLAPTVYWLDCMPTSGTRPNAP